MTKSNKPLVSVCIPTYNNEDYILETINCIRYQSYRKLEIIVVDDASSDNTLEVVNSIEDKRLKVVKNDTNLGMAGNWNKCLSLCKGKYIKLMCADDLIHRRLIEKEVAVMEKYPSVNLVQSDTEFIDSDNVSKGYYRRYFKGGLVDGREASKFSIFTRDFLGAPLANMIRKSTYDKLGGFDENIHYIIDYDFFMKLANFGKIYILHRPLNFFRIRNDSNTGQVLGGGEEEAYIREHRYLVEKYATDLNLSKWQVELSVIIRRITSVLGKWYLRLSLRK
ncbi:MAG: glycosyltransferase [Lachnospiraceae bacterium]|nr:glycosyltransferase [Lachnospiraceae bacterium]